MQISINNSGCTLHNHQEHRNLLALLPFFQFSLKYLRVVSLRKINLQIWIGWKIPYGETVQILSFDTLIWPQTSKPLYYVRKNVVIKTLLINYVGISATCLQYFSNKLGLLDKLQITGNSRHSTFNEELEWWDKLANLCLPLQKYNISTNFTTLKIIVECLLREIGPINT